MKALPLFLILVVAPLVTLWGQTTPAPSIAPTPAATAQGVRIKDLVRVEGLRENQLTGIGLVTGLAGQGDSPNNPMLQYALSSLAGNLGISIAPEQLKSKNTAVVTVTCLLPPFVASGDSLDVQIASLGDAKNLDGGVLLQTPLLASNGKTYAVAQGKVMLATGRNVPKTTGSIVRGAIAEKTVSSEFVKNQTLNFLLNRPDFTTAEKIGQALTGAFPQAKIVVSDSSRVSLTLVPGDTASPVEVVSKVESLRIVPDFGAKVVINRGSGVVVAGRQVQIAKVAVLVRGAKVTIGKDPKTGSGGATREQFLVPETTTVEDLVTLLQQIGLNTDTIVEVFQAIDQAGALYGTLEVTDR